MWKDKKGDWLIIDGGLKSGKIVKEARKNGVKLVTRLNSNFVVKRFGTKYRKEDVLSLGKPIERTIDGTKWIIYSFKRCIWQGSAGNLFLVKSEDHDDFIPIFRTSLNSKPETIIKKYNERSSIKQTNKELKSYLEIQGSYFTKKESNYVHIFMLSLVYNLIQYLRLYLGEISFKEALDDLSAYLMYKSPPKCVFIVENALNQVFHEIGSKWLDKIDIGFNCSRGLSEGAPS